MNKKLPIILIGAGKIASSILPAFYENGFPIEAVYSNKKSSAKQLVEKVNCKNFNNKIAKLPNKNLILIIAVPDSEIKKVVSGILINNSNLKGKIIFHLSGTLTSDELLPLKKADAEIASFHIMQTFPDKKTVPINNSYCAIESGNKKTANKLLTIAKQIKLKPIVIEKEKKIYFHLAGVFASNFLVGLIKQSSDIFEKATGNKNHFNEIMFPIIQSTLNNIKSKGIEKSLSGPVERGDFSTIEKHYNLLLKKDKEYFDLYILNSKLLLEIAFNKKSIDKSQFNQITDLLFNKQKD